MWVVKLGGSLADSEALPLWLEALKQCGVVIVPGGGPFADAVREAQGRWPFSDQTAHDMAILGMRQYGLMLADFGSLPVADEPHDLSAYEGRCVVWLPMPDSLNAAGIQPSWDITSDSIAAWLAGRLQATNLLLIKHADLSRQSIGCDELVSQGVVDAAFGEFFYRSGCDGWVVSQDGYKDLGLALDSPAKHFTHIGL
ncbi:MAG: amino acid kinase [Proteobacteria bacterium]|nr:amino acid kinase [Pseudomonadota bacterium]